MRIAFFGRDWRVTVLRAAILGTIIFVVDEYYVVGDNRTMDEHLHEKGICKRSQIVGKALL